MAAVAERIDEERPDLVVTSGDFTQRARTEQFQEACEFLDRLPDDYLLPHRDRSGKCPRCGTAIATLKSGGRTSYFCPRCQPAS